ncbi:MAG: heavy metal translocating P-type ATPase [Pseudomonadota bacterium]
MTDSATTRPPHGGPPGHAHHDGHDHGTHSHGAHAHGYGPAQAAPAANACCGCGHGSSPTAPAHGHAGHDHAGHDHSGLPGPWRLGAALAAAAGAELLHAVAPDTGTWHAAGMVLAVAATLLAGLGIYASGLRALLRAQLGIDALMVVAVTGAFLLGQWPEAAMVMALYALAERIEEAAADRARKAVGSLLALRPDQAEVQQADGQWRDMATADVVAGSVVRIRPGGRVPFDGTVTAGDGAVDESSITGESLPVDKAPGNPLYAGTLNAHAALEFRVTAAAGATTLDRVIRSVEEAQASRAPLQRLVDRFAAVYTPAVFAVALLVAIGTPLLLGWPWHDALYRALVLLVIACPCALVLSTPITVVSGIAAAARRGILVKGGIWLEQARLVRVVAFDKTGTLTEGRPVLVAQAALEGADEAAAFAAAAALAARSDHPVSRALAAGLHTLKGTPAGNGGPAPGTAEEVEGFTALAGRGVAGSIAGTGWILGNRRLVTERGLWTDAVEAQVAPQEAEGRSVTLLADGQAVRALFAVADTLRPQAREAVEALGRLGIATALLTGDHAAAAQAMARDAGITEVQAGLLPEEKLAAIARLQQQHGPVAMAGDGINDAPALAKADLGIAMGAAGTDVAMETAGIVILHDDLRRVAETVRLSRRTYAVLWQNIVLALGIKLVFLGLAVAGLATMWMAVFADVGASLLVVANGLRMLRMPR